MNLAAVGLFGVVLNNLLDGVNRVVEDAGNIGNDLLIGAGNQARQTIEQVKLSYADCLNMTVDKIDDTAKKILHDVENLAEGVIKKQANVIQDAANNSLLILNAIPFNRASEVPQLLSVSPRFVSVPDITDMDCKVQFTFRGNFLKANDPQFRPRLQFANIWCLPTSVTLARLDFEVPFDAILDRKKIKQIGPSSPGELVIPYKYEGGFFGLINPQLKSAAYRVFLRSLPGSPGDIDLKVTTVHLRRDVRTLEKGRYATFVTRERPDLYDQSWHLCSCSEGDCRGKSGHQPADPQFRGKNDDEERLYTVTPTPGWAIVPNTSAYRLETLQGTPDTPHKTRDDAGGVTYKIKTRYQKRGTSASVNVNINYTEELYYNTTESRVDSIALKWGATSSFIPDQLKIACAANCVPNRCTSSWKVSFTDFRGNHSDFIASVQSTYLKIQNVNGLSISAPQLTDLDELK